LCGSDRMLCVSQEVGSFNAFEAYKQEFQRERRAVQLESRDTDVD